MNGTVPPSSSPERAAWEESLFNHPALSCSPRYPAQPMQPRSLCPPIKEGGDLKPERREGKKNEPEKKETETEGKLNERRENGEKGRKEYRGGVFEQGDKTK